MTDARIGAITRFRGLAGPVPAAGHPDGVGAPQGTVAPFGTVDLQATDTALTPGTQYSDALFAHDATPTYVTAATTTSTTTAGTLRSISGTVTDAGAIRHGLAGVEVHVSSWSVASFVTATTAADGSYTVPGLAAGVSYQILRACHRKAPYRWKCWRACTGRPVRPR